MGSSRGRTGVGDVLEARERPSAREMLAPLIHDHEALELVARVVEVLAARSRPARRI